MYQRFKHITFKLFKKDGREGKPRNLLIRIKERNYPKHLEAQFPNFPHLNIYLIYFCKYMKEIFLREGWYMYKILHIDHTVSLNPVKWFKRTCNDQTKITRLTD